MGDLSVTALLSLAQFNGVNATSCYSGFGYDQTNDGFFFEVELGQCNMDVTSYLGVDESVTGEKFQEKYALSILLIAEL